MQLISKALKNYGGEEGYAFDRVELERRLADCVKRLEHLLNKQSNVDDKSTMRVDFEMSCSITGEDVRLIIEEEEFNYRWKDKSVRRDTYTFSLRQVEGLSFRNQSTSRLSFKTRAKHKSYSYSRSSDSVAEEETNYFMQSFVDLGGHWKNSNEQAGVDTWFYFNDLNSAISCITGILATLD